MNPRLSAIIIFKLQIKHLIRQEQRHPAGWTESTRRAEIKRAYVWYVKRLARASFASQKEYLTEAFVIFVLWSDIIGIFMSTIKHSLYLLQSYYFRSGLGKCCHAVSACWRADSSEFPIACHETQVKYCFCAVLHVIWEISWLSFSSISDRHR